MTEEKRLYRCLSDKNYPIKELYNDNDGHCRSYVFAIYFFDEESKQFYSVINDTNIRYKINKISKEEYLNFYNKYIDELEEKKRQINEEIEINKKRIKLYEDR